MIENNDTPPAPRGLPGGIPLPFGLLLLSFGLFVSATLYPESFDLGPHFNAAGIGVLGASCTMFWLLIAVAKRPPPNPPRGVRERSSPRGDGASAEGSRGLDP